MEVEIHYSKKETKKCLSSPVSLQRDVRDILSRKVSGTHIGLWLLLPEYLRLGSWELIKNWCNGKDADIQPRLAFQLVNESAMCLKGLRQSRCLCNQGFELLNGLPYIASDKEIHNLLDSNTVSKAQKMQIELGIIREKRGHYKGKTLAIDPYRVATYSKRIMPKKKKRPYEPSKKIMQNFFCLDAFTGQPVAFTLGSSGKTVSKASLELVEMIKKILPSKGLLLADTEHFTVDILDYISNINQFDILMPAPLNKKVKNTVQQLEYRRIWAGYFLGETTYQLRGSQNPVRLIGQRIGEKESDYRYNAFITTGNGSATDLLTEDFPDRWTIEEFFNFEAALGWNRVQTLNMNVLYGRSSLTLIAQAAIFQLREKLPKPYKTWTAKHIADALFNGIDGDIRVNKDTIIVTIYNLPESLGLKSYYENLPKILENEGVNPKIPWLYDFKMDFRFK